MSESDRKRARRQGRGRLTKFESRISINPHMPVSLQCMVAVRSLMSVSHCSMSFEQADILA